MKLKLKLTKGEGEAIERLHATGRLLDRALQAETGVWLPRKVDLAHRPIACLEGLDRMSRNLKTACGLAVLEDGMAATQAEVAKAAGITRGGVFMAERRAIRKLWRIAGRHRRAGTFDELCAAFEAKR